MPSIVNCGFEPPRKNDQPAPKEVDCGFNPTSNRVVDPVDPVAQVRDDRKAKPERK